MRFVFTHKIIISCKTSTASNFEKISIKKISQTLDFIIYSINDHNILFFDQPDLSIIIQMSDSVIEQEISETSARITTSNKANEQYVSNEVKSTSSNVLTFIPLNLLNQLSNMANIYFIIISIMQMIPSISVTHGTPTTLIPLSIVMLTVLIKDAYEQFYRYLKDKEENDRQIEVLVGRNFVYRSWESIRVGQVIKIRKNTSNDEPAYIPCDLLVIKTSDHENRAFVQTKSLDGQTNLKLRKSFLTNRQGRAVIQNQCYLKQFQIQYSQPNKYFGQFDGQAQYDGSKVPINTGNLILRGCTIENVHQVIGIAVYTGKDTKLVLNSVKFKPKKSKLMAQINKLVIEIFIYQVIVALVCSLFNNLLQNSYSEMTKMIPMSNFWITTCTWWLLMTYFVPISLMVTMEMVKLFQGSALFSDPQGYSKLYQFNTSANNTSVNQNLGQIRYVFTDKTGTLTKNNMVFKNLICGGILLGESDEDQQPNTIPENMRKSVNIHDKKLKSMKTNPSFQDALKVIYLCHQIYAESEGGVIKYNSSSPDEIALINFAKFQQRQFIGEHDRMIQIVEGTGSSKRIVKYQKLALLEFNSDRKRMSVVIRDPVDKSIYVYTKGADSTVKELLRPHEKDLQATQKHIDQLSVKGLRTLLLTKRKLTDAEFNSWIKSYQAAKGMVGPNKNAAIIKCEAQVQKNMELVGATAIEDELQDDVCQTITDMRLAGMTFFILTGDKRETAINIGRSCGLVDPDAILYDIPEYNQRDWPLQIKKLNDIKGKKVFLLNASTVIPRILPSQQTICYRCTPANKKSIVKTFKRRFPNLTMAVGDGSNDVNMITAADVGIGVKGKQGTEAARVADFVVGQFKFIKLLTLYYGRQWYRKNSILANYSFFKNWFHVSAVVAFGGYTYFSGVMIFDVFLYELFNVIFSSWPIIIWAVFDEQYTYAQSSENPQLYAPGINNTHFNQTVFLKNVGSAILYGVISLLITINTLEGQVLDSTGFIGNMKLSGSVLFGLIIIIINLYILLITTGIKPFILVISLASIAVYWLTQAIQAKLYSNAQYGNLNGQWKYANIFFNQIILIFFFILIEFGSKKYKQFNYKLQRMQQAKKIEEEVFKFMMK